MDAVLAQLASVLAPMVVAAIIGGLKYLYPKVRQNVPNLFWPVAAFGLAKVGTVVCKVAGATCSGNPFDWDQTTINALVVAALAVMSREAVKSLPDLKDKLGKVKDILTSK